MPGRELAIALAMRRWWSGVLCDTVVLLLGGMPPSSPARSYEETLALKEEMRKRDENGELAADLVHPSRWRVITKINNFEAVSFLNAPPLTRPGGGIVTNRSGRECRCLLVGGI